MRGIARDVQAGGDRGGPGVLAAVADGGGADRRGGPLEQAARVGPDGLRTHLCQGEHGRRRVRHLGQSKVCLSGATDQRKIAVIRSESKVKERAESILLRESSKFCLGCLFLEYIPILM